MAHSVHDLGKSLVFGELGELSVRNWGQLTLLLDRGCCYQRRPNLIELVKLCISFRSADLAWQSSLNLAASVLPKETILPKANNLVWNNMLSLYDLLPAKSVILDAILFGYLLS